MYISESGTLPSEKRHAAVRVPSVRARCMYREMNALQNVVGSRPPVHIPRYVLRAIVLVFLCIFTPPKVMAQQAVFERLGIADGLSNNTVTSILQDSRGFMWFGTQEGLNRYDGYTFTVYRRDLGDSTAIGSNRMLSIFEDRAGTLWVGTEDSGLDRFDRRTGKFRHFRHDPADPTSIAANQVEAIHEDRAGNLWVGTLAGLNRLDRAKGTFTRFVSDPKNPGSLAYNHVGAIIEDRDGVLWIGAGDTLHRFDPNRGTFERFSPGKNIGSPHDPLIGSIVEDGSGNLWIADWGGGLWKFDRKTSRFKVYVHKSSDASSLCNNFVGHLAVDLKGNLWAGTLDGLEMLRAGSDDFIHFRHDPEDPASIGGNAIWPLYMDRTGLLWIGAYRGGLTKAILSRTIFTYYTRSVGESNTLSDNNINELFEDRAGRIWIGTYKGLNRFDSRTGVFTNYLPSPKGLSADIVNAIWEDTDGVMWIGTSEGGLNRLDPRTGTFKTYRALPGNPDALGSDWVYKLVGDGHGAIIVGTHKGLFQFDRKSEKFSRIEAVPAEGSEGLVRALEFDRDGMLWVGTNRGLIRCDRTGGKVERFFHSPSDSVSLSDDQIHCVFLDSSGAVWIGTSAGLNRFDRNTGRFTRYSRHQGLINDVINEIREDARGALWLCTNAGLSRFSPRTGEIVNYSSSDGFPFRTFEEATFIRTRDGLFCIGGAEGFFLFHPDDLRSSGLVPPVVITSFKVFNREILFDRPIYEMPGIELTHRDLFFSFEASVLDFTSPANNRYSYKMDGFDRNWIYTGNRRYASYTNLDPGKYTFRVRGANKDGIWNERGASIEIVILPPFWATWWFRIAMILLGIGTGFGFHFARVETIKRQRTRLERVVEERTRELERKRAELEHSEHRYRGLVETSPDAIIVFDTEGRVNMANRQAADLFGVESGESLTGRPFKDFVDPADHGLLEKLKETIDGTGVLRDVTFNIIREAGTSFPVELNALVIVEDNTKRYMGVFRDISERNKAEEVRIERERMRVIIETAGAACHELNQPLQVITGYMHFLRTEDMDIEQRTEYILTVSREIARMGGITRKLNNITSYQTKRYAGGEWIIDLDKAAGGPGAPEQGTGE